MVKREQICLSQGFTPFGGEVICLPESQTGGTGPAILTPMQLGKIKAFETIIGRIADAESAFERGKRKRIKIKDESGEMIGRIPVTYDVFLTFKKMASYMYEEFMDNREMKQEADSIIFASTEPRRAEIASLNSMWDAGPAEEPDVIMPSATQIRSFISEISDERFVMDFGLGDPFES